MSLDYPSRAEWLAVRATPRKLPWRPFHMSAPLVLRKGKDGAEHFVVVRPGKTYRRGMAGRD